MHPQYVYDWLPHAPVDSSGINPNVLTDLDEKMIQYAVAEYPRPYGLILVDRPRAQRIYIHHRAATMGLLTTTVDRRTKRNIATVIVTRPDNWQLPDTPIPIPSPSDTARDRRATWQTCCRECECYLNASTALYHWSGLGPLCEACVEADGELNCLKWESMDSIWT